MMIMERPRLEFWSIMDVKTWASDALGSDIADLFEKEEISGECLSEISVEELKEMGVRKMGRRLLVMKKLKTLMQNRQSNANGQSCDSGVDAEEGGFSSPDSSPANSPRNSSTSPRSKVQNPSPVSHSSPLSLPSPSPQLPKSPPQSLPLSLGRARTLTVSPSLPPAQIPGLPAPTLPVTRANNPVTLCNNPVTPCHNTVTPRITSCNRAPVTCNRTTPVGAATSPILSSTVIRAPIAHIPSHLDLYHVPKRMRLSPPGFPPTMLHSTVTPPQVNQCGSLEEALTKLNTYSDMARVLSQQTLASSVCSLLAAESHHQKTRPGQVLKPIPQISSVTSHALTTASTASTQLSPVASISPSLSDMMLDMKSPILDEMKSTMMSEMGHSMVSKTELGKRTSPTEHHPPTVCVGDNVFQVNCRGKLTRESQERLKQVNPRLHSHYLTKRNLIKRACRTVFPDPPPFFYTDADRNSQEDLQILEQLAEKLAPVCCIPELCFSVQGIRNHIIDSCRERRRECKRQSYRPSKARPAGHLYNSDGTQITDSAGELACLIKDDVNDRPYTLSQDSADCIIRILFNVESVYHVRRSVHLIPITKRLGLSQRVDKNWMIMAIAQALVNNGYISFNQGADLERLNPCDFVLEVPEELLVVNADDIDVN